MTDRQELIEREADLVAAGRVLDRMTWNEIQAFREEMNKGQGRDDAGGYFLRCIARLFGIERGYNPQETYEQAARAAIAALRTGED